MPLLYVRKVLAVLEPTALAGQNIDDIIYSG